MRNYSKNLSGCNVSDAHCTRGVSARSSPCSDVTGTTVGYPPEEVLEDTRENTYEYYEKLLQIGGRPSREINPHPGPCPSTKSDIDKEYHELDHWTNEESRIKREVERWQNFRKYQEKARRDTTVFDRYKSRIDDFKRVEEIEWSMDLQLRWQMQSKVVEWLEYYCYEKRKRPHLERQLKLAQQSALSEEEGLRAKEREVNELGKQLGPLKWNGSTIRFANLARIERARLSLGYKDEIKGARDKVRLSRYRLEYIKADGSLALAEKNKLLNVAHKFVRITEKRLEEKQSVELDMLGMEYEIEYHRAALMAARHKLGVAESRLERFESLLRWIEEEFLKINRMGSSSFEQSQRLNSIQPRSECAFFFQIG